MNHPHQKADGAFSIRSFPYLGLCISTVVCLGTLSIGCGPSQEVLDAQEQDIQEAYEQAAEMPPNMPPHLQERRRMRLEEEFGRKPDAAGSGSKAK